MNTTTHCTSADQELEEIKNQIADCETEEQLYSKYTLIDQFDDKHNDRNMFDDLFKELLFKRTQLLTNAKTTIPTEA